MSDEALRILEQGTAHVIPHEDFQKKLATKKKLIIKLGIDPTSTDLHLGHAVVLSKLKQFQDLGHQVVFLIGDFTARIGDPSGKSKTRPPLTSEEITHNLQTYVAQVERILDKSKITIAFNSEWLAQLKADDLIRLLSLVTVARIIEREDFANRLATGTPIAMHELLYPVFQAYDSVMLKADVELGGSDQLFNMLLGRVLQEQHGQEPQVVMAMPLLEGLDGVQKMSKSLKNYIGLTEEPAQVFGKVMSISDELMWRYYHVLLGVEASELERMKQTGHPKELKKQLAHGIIARFWTTAEADAAQQNFEALFERKDYSQAQQVAMPATSPVWIVDLLKHLGAITTSSEAKRLIESGSVSIDGVAITDFKASVEPVEGMNIKVGKHRIYTLIK
jgi:tyrosyl-tRNA synthetase